MMVRGGKPKTCYAARISNVSQDCEKLRAMRNRFGALLLCSVLTGATAAIGGGGESSAGGWMLGSSGIFCSARMLRPPHTPYLIMDVGRADGATRMTMMGLALPKGYAPGWREFQADVTVKLNGKSVLAARGMKFERFFELERVAFDRLQAMSAPGQMVFAFKGAGGREEVVEFDSPGLGPGIASLKECLGRN